MLLTALNSISLPQDETTPLESDARKANASGCLAAKMAHSGGACPCRPVNGVSGRAHKGRDYNRFLAVGQFDAIALDVSPF